MSEWVVIHSESHWKIYQDNNWIGWFLDKDDAYKCITTRNAFEGKEPGECVVVEKKNNLIINNPDGSVHVTKPGKAWSPSEDKFVPIKEKELAALKERLADMEEDRDEWKANYAQLENGCEYLKAQLAETELENKKLQMQQKSDHKIIYQKCHKPGCGKTCVINENAYRCFYCGEWFCVGCAKEHFKKGKHDD